MSKAIRCTCNCVTNYDQGLTPRDVIVAAAKGNLALMQSYLRNGEHPDATIAGKPTALCYAAMSDDMDRAWLLIKTGALLDYQDGAGNNACIYAVLTDSGEVFELLPATLNPLDRYNHCQISDATNDSRQVTSITQA